MTASGGITMDDSSAPILTDSATVSGGYYPTGNVTFYLFGPGVTPASDFSNATYSQTDALILVISKSVSRTSTRYTLPTSGTVTGTYQWEAVYNGDKNNNTASDTSNSKAEQ